MTDPQTEHHANAHRAWDAAWQTEAGRARFLEPEPEVRAVAAQLLQPSAPGASPHAALRALDLGCGIGRHAIFLAEQGYAVDALDGSASGLAFAAQSAAARGLAADAIAFREGHMLALPYADACFDYVLAWNVIYHGVPAEVAQALAEIRRVLRPNGLFQATMLSKRHVKHGLGRSVAKDTFIIDDDEEKSHAHYYCSARDLVLLYEGFDVQSLTQREHDANPPGDWHWQVTAVRER